MDESIELLYAKILIVDDDEDILNATARILKKAGYTRVITASSGKQGLETAISEVPDLVLLDFSMPDMSGFEVCTVLKSHPVLKSAIVIMVSGSLTSSQGQADGLNIGADGYITRPFENDMFLTRINAMLRIKAAEQELQKEKERFRIIVTSSSDALLTIDHRSTVTYANPAARTVFSMKEKEILGKELSAVMTLFKSENEQIVPVPLDKNIQEFEVFNPDTDFLLENNAGEIMPVAVSISPEKGTAGNQFNAIVRIRDLTDQKKLEAERLQREKLETVQNMIVTMNHEINQSLSVIMSHAAAQMDENEKESRFFEDAALINDEAAKISGFIKKISKLQVVETAVYSGKSKMLKLDNSDAGEM